MSIQVLCPKCEEKLNCPDQFAGKLGKCPHCGAKFKVPVPQRAVEAEEAIKDSDVLAEDEMERVVDSDIIDRHTDPLYPQQRAPRVADAPQSVPVDDYVEPEVIADAPAAAQYAAAPVMSHPLAILFQHLWEQRMRGANVELILKDGERIAPERFAPGMSQATHGLFTVKSMDGSHTMVAVAWDTVTRITLRNMRELPPGIFQ